MDLLKGYQADDVVDRLTTVDQDRYLPSPEVVQKGLTLMSRGFGVKIASIHAHLTEGVR